MGARRTAPEQVRDLAAAIKAREERIQEQLARLAEEKDELKRLRDEMRAALDETHG